MYQLYDRIATEIQDERLREAANWRLAAEARGTGRGPLARLGRLLRSRADQPRPGALTVEPTGRA